MTSPTLEVHGAVGGYTGPGVKTIVPPRAEAKPSFRVRCPEAKVLFEAALEPYRADPTGPGMASASQAALEAFGKKPTLTREGGSIGAVLTMSHMLSRNILLLGLSLPEDGYHAIHESFAWPQAAGGMEWSISPQLPRTQGLRRGLL